MSLKSLFVKETDDDEIPVVVEKKATKKSTYQQPTSIGQPTPSQFSDATISTEEKNEFAQFLNGVYEQGNFEGPDYQEFTDALKEAAGAAMDEKTKFSTIFLGFKIQGVTKNRLIDTGNKYIAMINDQVTGFNAEIEKTLKTEVAAKQIEATNIAKDNDAIEKQMIALTEKKNKNIEMIQKLTAEANEQASSLNIKKASFKLAADEFIMNVKNNLDKIQLYLPEPVAK